MVNENFFNKILGLRLGRPLGMLSLIITHHSFPRSLNQKYRDQSMPEKETGPPEGFAMVEPVNIKIAD